MIANLQSATQNRSKPVFNWLKGLLLASALLPITALAIDQLGLYEIDGDVYDDQADPDSVINIFNDPTNGRNLINGLVDINNDGFITGADDGTFHGFKIFNGFVDLDGDSKGGVGGDLDQHDLCLNLCFAGYNVLFGYVDSSRDGVAPSLDQGEDAMNLLDESSVHVFQSFYATDDTTTNIQSGVSQFGITDVNNSDWDMFQGGGSKDPDKITNFQPRTVYDGLVDLDKNGLINGVDKGIFGPYKLVDGFVDVNLNGIPHEEADDGVYMGIKIIDGYMDMSGTGVDIPIVLATANPLDDGTISYWEGGWEWSQSQLQTKNDIYNVWAGTWLHEGAPVPRSTTNSTIVHDTNDFIMYFGADTIPATGTAAISFWFLQDYDVFPNPYEGTTQNNRQWSGSHRRGDLLIQTDISKSSTATSSVSRVYVWNPAPESYGLPPNDTSTPNLSLIFSASNCEKTSGLAQEVCTWANNSVQLLPVAWPYLNDGVEVDRHQRANMAEGGVNVSAVYRKLGIQVPCYAKAIAETRTTNTPTGTLTDFLFTAFESCSIVIRKSGDDVAIVGDTVTFNIEIENTGLLPLYLIDPTDPANIGVVSDPLVDAQSGPGTTLRAALAAGCGELQPREICSFPLTYTTSESDSDPFQNVISTTFLSADGADSFTDSDDHWVDLVYGGSISDQVWLDEDGNGEFDAGEDGIAGLTVILTPPAGVDLGAGDGVPITTTTDANGQYIFTDIPPGDYTVTIDAPAGTHATYDADGGLDNTTDITLALNEDINSLDFGLNWVPPADSSAPGAGTTGAIGDRVWNDANEDGVQDEGESGIANVGVVLTYDSTGDGVVDKVYATTVTDATGNYIFDDLSPGIYEVTVIGDYTLLPADGDNIDPATGGTALVPAVPDGFSQTGDPDKAGLCGTICDNTTTIPIVLGPGDVYLNSDFGYKADASTPVQLVSGTIYLDADADGHNDNADPGITGVSVSLLQEWVIVDGSLDLDRNVATTLDNGFIDGVEVIGGLLDINGDGVIDGLDDGYFNGIAVVNGFLDTDGDGITAGDTGDDGWVNTIVATTTTDADGDYVFPDVEQGFYSVVVSPVDGVLNDFYHTGDPDENNVCTICDDSTSFEVGTNPIVNRDFGYAPTGHEAGEGLITGTIGLNTVEDDSTVDPGEELAGVDVTLYQLFDLISDGAGGWLVDFNNDGVIDDQDNGVLVNHVDGGDLEGIHIVDGYVDIFGPDFDEPDGEHTSDDFYLNISPPDYPILEGFSVSSGILYYSGTPPSLKLEITTTTTDANGLYAFGDLDPQGKYSVEIDAATLPSGTTYDYDFDTGLVGPDGVAIIDMYDISNQNNSQTGVDFLVEGDNALSGTIWNDANADGTLAGGESASGIAGVTVELRLVYNIVDGLIDVNGDGLFNGLDVGSIGGIAVINGELDMNGDGVIDGLDDGSLQGVSVVNGQLDFDGDGTTAGDVDDDGQLDGGVVATTTTDVNGDYAFTNLPDGNFEVKVTDENGVLTGYWLADGPHDGLDNNSQSDPYPINLFGGQTDTTADFGYYIDAAAVGTIVFDDVDGDGMQDAGELGLAGIEVKLQVTYPSGDVITLTTLTGDGSTDVDGDGVIDPIGSYSFGNLLLDEDHNGAGINVIDGLLDINGDGTVDGLDDGAFDGINVINGYFDINNDGFITDLDDSTINGLSVIDGWVDVNGNGVDNAGTDAPADTGDDASLVDSSLQPTYVLTVDTTQAALNPGGEKYLSTDWRPAAIDDVTGEPGPGFGWAGDADEPDGTAAYPVQGSTDATNDFGFVRASSISGIAWSDDDGDGIHDAGEAGLAGIPVYLLDQDGNPVLDENGQAIMTVTSDGTTDVDGDTIIDPIGSYYFGDLYPCTGSCSYIVQFGSSVNIIDGLVDFDADGITNGDSGDVGIINGIDIINGYLDLNNNGVIDEGDDGMFEGFTVIDGWIDVNNSFTDTAGLDLPGDTGDDGVLYAMPDYYDITQQNATGGTDDSDAGNNPLSADYGSVTINNLTPGSHVTDINAGFRPLGTISGSVLADTNGSGTIDGDPGIRGVILDLYRDVDGSGTLNAADLAAGPVQTQVSGIDGSYSFEGVLIGDYFVVERQPAGFISLLDESINDGDFATNVSGDDVIPATLDAAGDVDNGNNFLETINSVVAVGDDNNTIMDYPVSGDVTFNDFDPEIGDTFTVTGLVIDANGDGVPDPGTDSSSAINAAGGIVLGGTTLEGAPVTTAANGGAGAGTLIINDDGSYTFSPAPGFTGEVIVEYTICDDHIPQACDTATLVITVSPWPDSQDNTTNSTVANDDEIITYGEVLMDNVLANDRDAEDQGLSVLQWQADTDGDGITDDAVAYDTPTTVYGVDESGNVVVAGTLSASSNGDYIYTPCTDTNTPVAECDGAFQGTLLVDYTITDDAPDPDPQSSDSATLTIHVLPETDELISGLASPPEANDKPVAGDDLVLAYFNQPAVGDWLSNDSDPNGDSLTLGYAFETPVTTAQGGSIVFHADGTFTYTPPSDYIGPDQLTYTICDVTAVDPQPLCDVATIYLVVLPGMDFGDLPDVDTVWKGKAPPWSNAPQWKVKGIESARHFTRPGLHLGSKIDIETNGFPDGLSRGDDKNPDPLPEESDEDSTVFAAIGFDDGDGINQLGQGETAYYKLGVQVKNDTGEDAVLVGYIDWNCNGILEEPAERARVIVDGDNNLATPRTPMIPECGEIQDPYDTDPPFDLIHYCALEWGTFNGPPLMSADSALDCGEAETDGFIRTYARLRLTTEPEFFLNASPSPNGKAKDGEVEDYNIIASASSTQAIVADFAATQHVAGGAVVSWTTASELGAVAFRVERLSGEPGENGSHWIRVHQSAWLPSRLEIQGGNYQVFDAGVEQGTQTVYRIIEKTSKGQQLTYGPYEVEVAAGAAELDTEAGYSVQERYDFDRVVENIETRAKARAKIKDRAVSKSVTMAAGTAKVTGKPAPGNDNSPDTLRIQVEHTGIHGLTVQELVAAFGSDTDQIQSMLRRGQLRLSSRGQDIPWYEQGGVLYFYAQGSDNQFSSTRTYWLQMKQNGVVMPVSEVAAAPQSTGTFFDSRDHEVDALWWLSLSTDPDSDYWFWNILSPFQRVLPFNLPVPGAQASDGELKLRLWGASNAEHLLTVRTAGINSQVIGQLSFSGDVPYETLVPLSLPAAVMGSDTLALEVVLEASPSGGYSSVLVDGFEVSWLRAYRADAGALKYPAAGATSVSGFGSAQVITMDVLNPAAPLWITGGDVSPATSGFAYSADLPLSEYASAEASQVFKPASMELDKKSDLRNGNNRADYVIITQSELMEAAKALAVYRNLSLKTLVVDIQDIYDEFSAGEPLPTAMNAFTKASQLWKTVPRYMVILGDGSFDYRDIMGTGYNFVSPQMYGTSNGLFASDTLQGDVNNDGIPEVAFGRITVKSNAEGLAYITKLSNYEAGIGELPSLLLTDIPDKGGDFTYSQFQVEQQLAGDTININLQKTSITQAREDLDMELDHGVRMINYLGHGGIDRVSAKGLIVNADAAGMDNLVTPGFVGLSCLINNYSVPGWDGLGERLVVQPGAGMVVSWAASGESYNDQATALGVHFHSIEGNYQRLGDAIIATFRDRPYLIPVYTLLGDPALRMQ